MLFDTSKFEAEIGSLSKSDGSAKFSISIFFFYLSCHKLINLLFAITIFYSKTKLYSYVQYLDLAKLDL